MAVRDYPIVYQDVMRVIVAGPLGEPTIGIGRRTEVDSPLLLTVAEARELAQALTWALNEYDDRCGRESFYREEQRKRGRSRNS